MTGEAETEPLDRITARAGISGGKLISRDMRTAMEHVLTMLAAEDTMETALNEYRDLHADER